MTDAVLRSTQGRIGILTVNNPPVNALAAAVRNGIKEGVEAFGQDPNIDAIVLIGGGRTFIAGADIREFGKPPSGANLNDVIATMENCPKIVVAALHGTPLGGGLETALGAHYRVVAADHARRPARGPSRPAARRRRHAAPAAPHRREVRARRHHLGPPHPRARGQEQGHHRRHRRRATCWPAPWRMPRCWWRRTRRAGACATSTATLESPDLFKETEKAIARRARGFKAPWNIIKCVQAAVELPFDEGMKRERELFVELLTSPESAAQRYYFFAEREAAKVLDVPADTPQREIKTAGIIGAGTMGGGIAMNFANAGIPVTLARGEAGGARPRPEDHPHQLREHRQARRHEGRGRRQAHGADHADALLRRPQGRRRHHRGGVRDDGSEGRRLQASSTRSPSRARCWPPTPRASTSTRSPPTPSGRATSSACTSSRRPTS